MLWQKLCHKYIPRQDILISIVALLALLHYSVLKVRCNSLPCFHSSVRYPTLHRGLLAYRSLSGPFRVSSAATRRLVGQSGIEPPTSRLSVVCSKPAELLARVRSCLSLCAKRCRFAGGDEGIRTPDLLRARQALSHLSYAPKLQGRSGLLPFSPGEFPVKGPQN